MSKALRASALILLLACSAHAGHMPNGSPVSEPTPTPPPATITQEESAQSGVMHTPLAVEEVTAETILTVFTSLLALL